MYVTTLWYYLFLYLRWLMMIMASLLLLACAMTPREFRNQLESHVKQKLTHIAVGEKYSLGYLTSDDLDSPALSEYQSVASKRSNVGAIRFSNHDDKKASKLFTLYREHKRFMAETKIHEQGDKKFFFSFGVDRETHMPALGLRVEF